MEEWGALVALLQPPDAMAPATQGGYASRLYTAEHPLLLNIISSFCVARGDWRSNQWLLLVMWDGPDVHVLMSGHFHHSVEWVGYC